jgi:hypothetical protein
VDDVPLAGEEPKLGAEFRVRVGLLLLLFGDGFEGRLCLVGGVDVEGVVDHGVGLWVARLGHGIEHRVEVDVVAFIVDDVHRTVLGRLDRLLVVLGGVAFLGLVDLGGLLSGRSPVDVVALVL